MWLNCHFIMLNQNIDRFPSAFPYQSSSSNFNPTPSSIAINKSEPLKHFMPSTMGLAHKMDHLHQFSHHQNLHQVLSTLLKQNKFFLEIKKSKSILHFYFYREKLVYIYQTHLYSLMMMWVLHRKLGLDIKNTLHLTSCTPIIHH